MHINPIRELEEMIRALGIFKRQNTHLGEGARALPLHGWPLLVRGSGRDGGSLREEAVPRLGAQLGPRVRVGRVDHTSRGRRLVAVDWDETVEKANGREVYVGRHRRGYRGAPRDRGVMPSGPGAPRTRSSS